MNIDRKIKYKHQELVQIEYPNSGVTEIQLDYSKPVDMIRVTCFDNLSVVGYNPGLLVWCDIVNNYIGTCLTEHVAPDGLGNYDFSKVCKPQNGICFWFHNKIVVDGNHEVRFSRFDGTLPTANTIQNEAYILFEYFAFEK
jgi:hypothetical protein